MRFATTPTTRAFASKHGLSLSSALVVLASIVPLATTSLACKSGGAADAIRPADPTYAAATGVNGAAECRGVEAGGAPLVVDWRPEDRGDLEVALRSGIAVVHYDCQSLRVLPACTVEGSYAFMGMTTKEQVVRLESADEVRANLPQTGLSLAAKLDAEMKRGATLDIALVMVGKWITARDGVPKDALKGDCKDATHFVRGATVGAFAMQTGSKADAKAAISIFGAGTSGGSSASKSMRSQDGKLEACGVAKTDAKAPPEQCGAMLRVQLAAFDGGKQTSDKATSAVATQVAGECPAGMARVNDKCTAAEAESHLCAPGDATDCKAQCAKGESGSCVNLGMIYERGLASLPVDHVAAVEYFKKGCDGGVAVGCFDLAVAYDVGRGAPVDKAHAVTLYDRSCDAGEARGCYNLALSYAKGEGITADKTRAAALYQRACDGGWLDGCYNLARVYRKGEGVGADNAKAAEIFGKACGNDEAWSCGDLGFMYAGGLVAAKPDRPKAAELYKKACDGGYAVACGNLGAAYEDGNGVPKDLAKAAELYRKGCDGDAPGGCAGLGEMHRDGTGGLAKDLPKSKELLKRACDKGSERGCKALKAKWYE
jgi:hypothetical protein